LTQRVVVWLDRARSTTGILTIPNQQSGSPLRIRPGSAASGTVVSVTPEQAGWGYVGFEAVRLGPGEAVERPSAAVETCLVVISGRCTIHAGETTWRDVGERATPFDGPPYAAYIPAATRYRVEAQTELELGLGTAPSAKGAPLRLIGPDEMEVVTRGAGTEERQVCNILMAGQEADALLVTEVVTPAGHWSSYPPHKHDRDDLPDEAYLEETYYHRIRGGRGFAFQRVYTDDRSLDESFAVEDGDLVLVPRGYHPVAASPAADLYYLNVMAGPAREWRVRADPGFPA
jgi:5-deoxy-glucuronate isomerase